ncbi:orotate phosphoribosyltransferase-like protein [Methanoregula sp.]|uniref:orotate phosphoribosyltransferase-like protein n=1 Tax=Methanoregula sp. TaxID=2052170 RepID=UPI002B68E2DA|nr:orotate phosphoribosyltransferase-like protein [Methanoregula sp.]HVP95645.1 orotate phosphoribosyltransferase-like protein [Methanoregula sp.]
MSSLDDLIARAKLLLSEGHSPGQIADELSLSMETVTWLLTQANCGAAAPKDVHIDWTAVSSQAPLLDGIALMLLNRYYSAQKDEEAASADVIVGIALSGIPLATVISVQEAAKLAIYHPSKQNTSDRPVGSISGNFAPVAKERCIIVDDVITSGNTMREVVKYLKKHGAVPVAIWVIFDKRGIRDIDGVPVYSLFTISRID